jgi:diguanylate cyclase (GGDEF)-like protein
MSVGGRALRDADGTLVGGIDALRDIQAEHEAREELLRQAHLDPLTGLPNRRALLEHVAGMLGPDRPTQHPVVAMFLDVDHLKRVNDTFGHEGGDDVLVEIGQRLTTAVTAADVVARVGGDEFVVLLGGDDSAARADETASRVARRLRYPIRLGVEQVVVGASIGVTTAVPGDTVTSLLRRADSALYAAKLGGRGRIEHA